MERRDIPRPPAVVFNTPPGWPPAPIGWLPPPDWRPPAHWPAVPSGWDLYLELPHDTAARHRIVVRTVAPRYADPAYFPKGDQRPNSLASLRMPRPSPKRFWSRMSKRGRLQVAILTAVIALLGLSALASSGRAGNSLVVARQHCPPAVAKQIAERLEVPESNIIERSPKAGLPTIVVPPRAPTRTGQALSQATFVNASLSGTAITAEGNYRTQDNSRWQFSCTIDMTGDPTVTRVAISPIANAPSTEG